MEHAEFQVVILAGGSGSRMYPLTTELAKPLLPIANRPMISYQLELLERAGFAEAIVIAQESAASGLKNFIVDFYKGKIKIDWNFLPDFMGTAEALLRIKNKIKSDFIVISGDLIVDNRFLHNMADRHRTQDATATLLITPRVEEENVKSAKGAKVTNEFGLMDYIGFAPDGARLLYFKAAADVENRMEISKTLLMNEPNITIHTDLIDSHFYIFSKHVMRLLEKRSDILSIKGELVPYLVSAQYSKSVSEEDLHIKRSQHTAYTMTTSGVDMEDNIRCFAYLMRDGYCGRANTIKSYMQMNLDISTRGACYQPSEPLNNQSFISPLAVISPQTQIAVDCVVGQGTKIGDKCSIKKSVIGKHCHIEDKVKIINSVIMNHVTISAGCVINGSIVCDNVHMKPGCTIKDSQIGVAYHVPERSEIKNETLCVETDSGWMDI